MRTLSVGFASGVVVLLSILFLVGSTPDEEEFRFAILSAWQHADALRHGHVDFWTTSLGLGIPQPFSPAFLLHPLLPLLTAVSPASWARVLLVVHTLLGATGMWQLARRLRLTSTTAALCVTTFLLATPAQNYALADFWLSHYIVWTSAPWLLLLAFQLLEADARTLPYWSIASGLCAGLVIANTNPGHLVVYGTVVGAMLIVHWRRLLERARWVACAVLIATALASPGLAQLAHERRLFASGLESWSLPAPLPRWAAWNVFFSPLAFVDERLLFSRTLFFGGPFAVLCLIACARFTRRHADLVLIVATSAVLLFTPLLSLPFVSARFQFRDPLILAAIPLAGLAFEQLLAARHRLAMAVLVAQLGVLVVSAWPALSGAWISDARRAQWFRGGSGETDAVDVLLNLARPVGRTVFTPRVDEAIFEESRLVKVIGVNALAYRGLPVVNGWFKGVSADTVWPEERMLYGRVRVPTQLSESAVGLDVLGIRYVIADPGELVAPDLQQRGVIPNTDGTQFVLYENTNAWPGAFVVRAAAEHDSLSRLPGCENSRLLCTDLAALAARRVPGELFIRDHEGRIDVRLFPATEPQLLVVTQMFRPDWVATSGDTKLTTVPAAGGLLGVRVPTGVSSVRLRYRPIAVMASTGLAWCTLAGAGAALIVLRKTRRA